MRTIWKYPFEVLDEFTIAMPSHSQILCVQTQREQGCIWAYVDPDEPTEGRRFRLIGTGHPIDDLTDYVSPINSKDSHGIYSDKYVGTFQLQEGYLVFHLFEKWQNK